MNSAAFNAAFIKAMTKLCCVGVKTGHNGNIRRDCEAFSKREYGNFEIPFLRFSFHQHLILDRLRTFVFVFCLFFLLVLLTNI